ncbi:MAG: DUF4296 domain-containing protein [Bacteroidota bacterium]
MNTLLIKILVVSCFLFSCSPPNEEDLVVPKNLLTEEQLIQVLTDIYLAESASGINIKAVAGEKFDSAYIFKPLKDNQINKGKFDSTLNFYTKHPKKLKIVYEKVLDKLSVIQAKGKLE